MRLENFRIETGDRLTQAVVTVVWENSNRPNKDIYFGTTQEYADDLSCNPHAFLLACIMPAMRCGEKRIYIDAEICPELKAGLEMVVSLTCHWYGGNRQPVEIDVRPLQTLPERPAEPRAGFFFSGGVDSLSTLRGNRLRYPPSHPGHIKDGFLIYGIESYDADEAGQQLETFDSHIAALKNVAKSAEINLIPVYTNVKSIDKKLEKDWIFWEYEFQGTVLAAVAHTFFTRITEVFVASSCDIKSLGPLASHPMTDPNFSSCYLRIHHDNFALSRLDKVKLIADWPVALDNLKVCFSNQPDKLNCGICEKCLRTMAGLETLHKLPEAGAFKESEIDPELFERRTRIGSKLTKSYYMELIAPLEQAGRKDLVRAIYRNINRFHERDWKGRIKRADRRLLKGFLSNWKQKRKQVDED
ncbi:MAG: hypothetical protein AAFN12_00885 [Cyanobacteria bacterium J06560_2]